MPVIAEVTIVPLGTKSPSLSPYVAACHRILQEATDIRYQLTPMSTIIEGELPRILEIVQKMHQVPFDEGAQRVSTTIRIDDRRDKSNTMEGKVNSVILAIGTK
ncbi:MTH1187 family thiamine-binding protein [Heliorestis convoluta]|uniref:MTH1187 family thiamine-binding protein n=1 Tax=Heliorestis convoluta TaxID=356322 RepID=A0A5Q2MYQ7_9FIRM|nr:MTH1187 family thiamine-binding protein [Heliorestis convoluta]QGG47111.1 MTH1187 family thiamine-binding protein [Heliorestis convoluta]